MADTREGKTVRLPPELWQRAKEQAEANKRSVTREIEIVLEEYLRMRSAAGITDGMRGGHSTTFHSRCGACGHTEILDLTPHDIIPPCPQCGVEKRRELSP